MQKALYQDIIVEHSRRPRHYGVLECATVSSQATNRVCGDSVVVYLRLQTTSDGEYCTEPRTVHGTERNADTITSEPYIAEITFTAKACALAVASASLMTTLLQNKTENDARRMLNAVEQFLRQTDGVTDEVRDWQVFEGVHANPSRIKCVLLPWQALMSAFDQARSAQIASE